MQTGFNWFVVLGAVAGVFLRTVGPYLLKVSKGKESFDWKYLRSAAIGAAIAALGGGFTVAALDPQTPWAVAVGVGFGWGYLGQDATRRVEKRAGLE